MEPTVCRVNMSVSQCCRPIYAAPTDCDEKPVCLMHSRDPNKPQDEFDKEVRAILDRSSNYHRPKGLFDFYGFVFQVADFNNGVTFPLKADFREAVFIKDAGFASSVFIHDADFRGAIFTHGANFYAASFTLKADFGEAVFSQRTTFINATFAQRTDFSRATFIQGANFSGATFCDAAFFDDAVFGPRKGAKISSILSIAVFRDVRLLKPELVRFLRTNARAAAGLWARFVNCHVEGVQFDAVRWHRIDGRMVLQDELDILDRVNGELSFGEEGMPVKAMPWHRVDGLMMRQDELDNFLSYEETAIAYRRLIINFEKARSYDLAEDCTIGEFEMKRRDPSRFIFAKRLESLYDRFPRFRRWVGEWLSVVGIYRLASVYGTSYQRAGVVLVLLLLGFVLAFATIIGIHSLPSNPSAISTCSQLSPAQALCSGLVHALEVATLQREVLYKPDSPLGRIVEIFEQVFIAGQAALLLFALRRRFRR